jgi:8-oxo-dGTP diphosphatase
LIQVALAVVLRQGRVLLARRRAGGHLPGLWEFPGGRVRPGEEASRAALRELREETGLVGGRTEALLTVPYAYPDREVVLEVYQVADGGGEARPLECEEVAWLRPDQIHDETMPPANAPILRFLRSRS